MLTKVISCWLYLIVNILSSDSFSHCFFLDGLVVLCFFLIKSSICRDCSVSISEFRDGQRHDMWLSLDNIKTGRLHLAVTVVEENAKVYSYIYYVLSN